MDQFCEDCSLFLLIESENYAILSLEIYKEYAGMKTLTLQKQSEVSDYLKREEKHNYNISFEGLDKEYITVILSQSFGNSWLYLNCNEQPKNSENDYQWKNENNNSMFAKEIIINSDGLVPIKDEQERNLYIFYIEIIGKSELSSYQLKIYKDLYPIYNFQTQILSEIQQKELFVYKLRNFWGIENNTKLTFTLTSPDSNAILYIKETDLYNQITKEDLNSTSNLVHKGDPTKTNQTINIQINDENKNKWISIGIYGEKATNYTFIGTREFAPQVLFDGYPTFCYFPGPQIQYYQFTPIGVDEKIKSIDFLFYEILGKIQVFISFSTPNPQQNSSHTKPLIYPELSGNISFIPTDWDDKNVKTLQTFYITIRSETAAKFHFVCSMNYNEETRIFLKDATPLTYSFSSEDKTYHYFIFESVFLWYTSTRLSINLQPIKGQFIMYLGKSDTNLSKTNYDYKTEENAIEITKNSNLSQNQGIYTILVEGIGEVPNFEFTIEYYFSLLRSLVIGLQTSIFSSTKEDYLKFTIPKEATGFSIIFTSFSSKDPLENDFDLFLSFQEYQSTKILPNLKTNDYYKNGKFNSTEHFGREGYEKKCDFETNCFCDVYLTIEKLREYPYYLEIVLDDHPVKLLDGQPKSVLWPQQFQPLHFYLDVNAEYGQLDAFVSTESVEKIQNLPNNLNNNWSFKNLRSVQIIQSNDPNYCTTCYYFIQLSGISNSLIYFTISKPNQLIELHSGFGLKDEIEVEVPNYYRYYLKKPSEIEMLFIVYEGDINVFSKLSNELDWKFQMEIEKKIQKIIMNQYKNEQFFDIKIELNNEFVKGKYQLLFSPADSQKKLNFGQLYNEELEPQQIQTYVYISPVSIGSNQEINIELQNCTYLIDQPNCLIPEISVRYKSMFSKSAKYENYDTNFIQRHNFLTINLLKKDCEFLINIANQYKSKIHYAIMVINLNQKHSIITEQREQFTGQVDNIPRYYEFYHPRNYSQMNTLIEIKNCISEVQVAIADSYGDLILRNGSFEQNQQLPYENKQILLIPLYKNPLYLSIQQFQINSDINWQLMNKEFNISFNQKLAAYYLKRTYIPKTQKSPYDYINYPEKPLTYKINSKKISFQVQPLQCENHCLSTGFAITSYIYALHIWDDPNVLKYRINCNPSLQDSEFKGFSYYLQYSPPSHNALNFNEEFIDFPEFEFDDIKQSVFLNKKSRKKLVYASVQAYVTIKFNERLFDGLDEQFKDNFENCKLSFEYPISEIILEAKEFWLNKTFWIVFLIIVIILIGISLFVARIVHQKTQKRLTELNLDISDVKNLEIGLKPIQKLPEQNIQPVISFGAKK